MKITKHEQPPTTYSLEGLILEDMQKLRSLLGRTRCGVLGDLFSSITAHSEFNESVFDVVDSDGNKIQPINLTKRK